jgi:hypothetical protein
MNSSQVKWREKSTTEFCPTLEENRKKGLEYKAENEVCTILSHSLVGTGLFAYFLWNTMSVMLDKE